MSGSRIPRTTPQVVRAAAETWPDREAIVDGGVRLTFAQLRAEVDRVARAAVAAGLRKGDRAAIWAPNRWEWAVTALGVHRAGGVLVPLNTRYKGDEAAYILKRGGVRLLFTVQGFLGLDLPALLAGRDTPVERTVVFGTESWQRFLDQASDVTLPEVAEDDLADILFTSGTTGRPKGVMTTHGQTVAVPRSWASVIGLRAGDRHLVVAPFFHTFGYRTGIIADLLVGATTVPLAVVEVEAVLALVAAERITVLPAPPTVFQSILATPPARDYDLSSLRLSAVGASSVPVELVHEMRAKLFDTVVTGYGLTESTGVTTMSRPGDPPEVISRTVGQPLPGVEVRIVDEDGAELPRGEPGEVVVRGYNVMRGYFEDPEQTAEAIDSDGWLHTGDIGTMDGADRLRITDRLKDMYIVGGFNAYPAEIEAMLLGHPQIAQVAVIGIPDERLGEVGKAYVVPADGTAPTGVAIIEWARERMANYKVPRQVAIVEELPVNAVGKVVKDLLRATPAAS